MVLLGIGDSSETATRDKGTPGLGVRLVLSLPVDRPTGVAVSLDGERIYVAANSGLRVFDGRGRLLGEWTLPGGATPPYVALAPDSQVLVTDSLHRALHRFAAEGRYLGEVGSTATYTGERVRGVVSGGEREARGFPSRVKTRSWRSPPPSVTYSLSRWASTATPVGWLMP